MKVHSKVTKIHFWMIQRAKKEVFDHLMEFDQLDRLGIAYYDSTKYFATFRKVTMSLRIIQRSPKCILEWSKRLKKRFCAIFCSSVCWIYLILPELVWIKKEVWEFLKVKEVKDVRNCWFSRGRRFNWLKWSPFDRTLQFSTSVEVRPGNSQLQLRSGLGMLPVCPCVRKSYREPR